MSTEAPDLSEFAAPPPEAEGLVADHELEEAPEDLAEKVAGRAQAAALNKMAELGEKQGRRFTEICNDAVATNRVTQEDASGWMKHGLGAIAENNPATGALVLRALAQVPGLAARYRRMEPGLAAAMLTRDAEKIADLVGTSDELSIETWLDRRNAQMARKNKPAATATTSKPNDRMGMSAWLRAREAEVARKGGR